MRKALLTLMVGLLAASLSAQRSEVGLTLGTTYYLGDLNYRSHFGLTQPAGGLLYRYNLNPRWALKMNAIYGEVLGDDASSVGENPSRNLSFKSHVLEFGANMELNFFRYFTGSKKSRFSPYIFGGVSLFSFNPQAEYDGEWYELQPLGTEGQGTTAYPDKKIYALTQVAFPFGIGFKYSASRSICIGAEWGMRKTFTDYLDDVSTVYADPDVLLAENTEIAMLLADRSVQISGEPPVEPGMQRGDSKNKDWYSYAGAFLTFKIRGKNHGACSDFQGNKSYRDYIYER
ncbi:MAG TPA: DUF6089 family protein [Bacteroidales bacterium]|nr:DUF6089 family protein [Bacteroidales bacterium]HRZ77565.1 DUF6089 family protein [Bacteroidales bacterium]